MSEIFEMDVLCSVLGFLHGAEDANKIDLTVKQFGGNYGMTAILSNCSAINFLAQIQF